MSDLQPSSVPSFADQYRLQTIDGTLFWVTIGQTDVSRIGSSDKSETEPSGEFPTRELVRFVTGRNNLRRFCELATRALKDTESSE